MKYPKDYNVHRPPHTFLPGACYFVSARTYFALPYLWEDRCKQILLKSIEKAVEKFSLTLFGWVILDNHYHLQLKLPEENNKIPVNSSLRSEYGTGNLVTSEEKQSDRFQPVVKSNKPKLVNPAEEQSDRLQPVSLDQVIGFIHGRSSRFLRKFEIQKAQSVSYDFTPQESALLKQRFFTHLGEKYLLTERRRIARFKQLIDTGDIRGLNKFMRSTPKIWYQYLDHVISGEADFYCHLNYIHQNPVKHGLCKNLLDYKFSSIHKYVEEFGKEWITDCFRRYPIIDFQPNFEDW